IRAGGLPVEGAQVVLEAIAANKKEVNPNGLAFVPAAAVTSENALAPVAPLVKQSLEQLRQTLKDAGSTPSDVLRVTCFVSTLENFAETRKLVEAEYPRAALDYVQTQRAPARAVGACEAIARLTRSIGKRVQFLPDSGEPRAALIAAPQVV